VSQWTVFERSDPPCFWGIGAFIEALSTYGIATNHPTVADCAIFTHQGIRQTIEMFLQRHPHRPLPLTNITIVMQVAAETELDTYREAMLRFANDYNIGINLQIYLSEFNAEIASRISAFVEDGVIENLVFVFGFPSITPETATAWRSELAMFLDNPRSRLPGVSLAGFPFCFAPPDQFKSLFRYSLNDLRSLIGSQRYTIVKVTGQTHRYLPVCATCRCKAACYAFTDIEKHPGYAPVLTPQTEDTVAFVGGSLAKPERIRDTGIVYTTPAEQGDLLMAILAGFRNILIIDGYFYSKFPCTTFEIMLALEQGLNVFGAASIGALRAVELDHYGMTGIGYVYGYLRRHAIKPYHVVAQTYRQDDTVLTPPLIEIIYFLECAMAEGVINQAETDRCLKLAATISFFSLTFASFFRLIREAGLTTLQLENYFNQKDPDHFRIKRADALQLLGSFRQIIASRTTEHVLEQFCRARDKYLNILYAKYRSDSNLTLTADWRTSSNRPRRELPASETCRLAEKFFRDLDVVVADTTGFDPPASSFIINVFFVPFYFLGYPLSSSTGNGDVFDEALASAYMELVERIPTHNFRIAATGPDLKTVPLDDIPQYYNFAAAPLIKEKVVKDHGNVTATDMLTGESCTIPRFAVMSMFTGTDGNAAGNSLAEAILYGLYELVERDTNQLYQLDPVCREQIDHLRLDPDSCDRESISRLEEKGYRLALFQLPNIFGLPCVRCRLFDLNRNIECHGSTAVRADFHAAVSATLHEAFMQHISYFTGIRDDYRTFQSRKEAHIAYQTAKTTLFDAPPSYLSTATDARAFPSVAEELDYVVGRLRAAGIRRIIVANTSPAERYVVKSVKVIVPGMELWFVPEYQPSGFARERILKTRTLIL
jgi:YcaO-like protein with predicted kinase domain